MKVILKVLELTDCMKRDAFYQDGESSLDGKSIRFELLSFEMHVGPQVKWSQLGKARVCR